MRGFIVTAAMALSVILSSTAGAGEPCSPPSSQYCQNLQNAETVYQQQRQQQAVQDQQRQNQENGTSQYTGPTVKPVQGGAVAGYRWSTK